RGERLIGGGAELLPRGVIRRTNARGAQEQTALDRDLPRLRLYLHAVAAERRVGARVGRRRGDLHSARQLDHERIVDRRESESANVLRALGERSVLGSK